MAAFETFTKDLFVACDYEPAAAGIPVTVCSFTFKKVITDYRTLMEHF